MASTKRVKTVDELSQEFDSAAKIEEEITAKFEALVAEHKKLVANVKPMFEAKKITADEALKRLRPSTQAIEEMKKQYDNAVKTQEKAYKAYMNAAGYVN